MTERFIFALVTWFAVNAVFALLLVFIYLSSANRD